MRKLSKKSKAIVAIAAVIGLASSGVAYAYWTTTGDGTGTAATSSGSLSGFSVAGNVPLAMFPGDSGQTITATVTNNGTENNKVQLLKAWITTENGGCDGSNFKINGTQAPIDFAGAVSLGITPVDLIPTGTATKTYSVQFNNKTSDQNSCKNAVVTVHYAAS